MRSAWERVGVRISVVADGARSAEMVCAAGRWPEAKRNVVEAGCPLGGFIHNIAEGSKASGTSKKMELKLTNVARSSLEELKLDYEDFLRQRGLPLWPQADPRRAALVARRCRTADEVAEWIREVRERSIGPEKPALRPGAQPAMSIPSIRSTQSIYAEISANAAHVLIGVACALLDRQIEAQAAAFEREGGFTERLYRIRSGRR